MNMTTNITVQRVADRFRRADAFIRLDAIPVPPGWVIDAAHVERLLRSQGIEAHDVVLYSLDDPQHVIRWEARDGSGGLVMGRLELKFAHDSRHLNVSGELTLVTTTAQPK